jgi:hypothetical protein
LDLFFFLFFFFWGVIFAVYHQSVLFIVASSLVDWRASRPNLPRGIIRSPDRLKDSALPLLAAGEEQN